MYICGIQENGTNGSIWQAGMESHGQRNLEVRCSPQGRKESDMTEAAENATHIQERLRPREGR